MRDVISCDIYIHHYQIIKSQINIYNSKYFNPRGLALKGQYISTYSEAVVAVHKVVKQALKGRNKLFRPFRAVVAIQLQRRAMPFFHKCCAFRAFIANNSVVIKNRKLHIGFLQPQCMANFKCTLCVDSRFVTNISYICSPIVKIGF